MSTLDNFSVEDLFLRNLTGRPPNSEQKHCHAYHKSTLDRYEIRHFHAGNKWKRIANVTSYINGTRLQ